MKSSKSSVSFTFTAVSFPVSCMSAGHSLPTLSCTRSLISSRPHFYSPVGLLQILLTTMLSPALSLFSHAVPPPSIPTPSPNPSHLPLRFKMSFLVKPAWVFLSMLVPLSLSEKYTPPSENSLSFVIINSLV